MLWSWDNMCQGSYPYKWKWVAFLFKFLLCYSFVQLHDGFIVFVSGIDTIVGFALSHQLKHLTATNPDPSIDLQFSLSNERFSIYFFCFPPSVLHNLIWFRINLIILHLLTIPVLSMELICWKISILALRAATQGSHLRYAFF